MRFSDLMGEPDSDPPATDRPATSAVAEPGFAQLNVAESAPATLADAETELERLEGLEAIDDDLLPRAQRRGRR